MPRLLRRLTIAFAVLALGLVLAGWVAMRVIATNVIEKQAEPVHQRLVADWAAHADALERDLAAAAPFGVTTAPTPTSLGCELRWLNAEAPHAARCGDRGPAIADAVLEKLDALGDDVLRKANDAPTVERDFAWMAELKGHDDWALNAGTPLEYFDLDPGKRSVTELPVIDGHQLRALSTLRLLAGVRSGALTDAVSDVVALCRAVLNRPVLVDQLVAVSQLEHLHAQLAAIEQATLAPSSSELEALRSARLAGALLWHPWVPRAQRERFLPKLPAATRCAATGEALALLELGEPLHERYPDFISEITGWQGGACHADFTTGAFAARTQRPSKGWQRALRNAVEDPGAVAPSVTIQAGESSPLVRSAVLETLLTLMLARPFPEPLK